MIQSQRPGLLEPNYKGICLFVLIAAALGADYVAPYLGRINDLGRNGREDLVAMQQACMGVGSATRILVASIRSVDDITLLATQGLNTFTFSPLVAAAFARGHCDKSS